MAEARARAWGARVWTAGRTAGRMAADTQMEIRSSDPELLAKAMRIADTFAGRYMRPDIAGIVFLGAIVRGYFDREADIDIALFTKATPAADVAPQYQRVDGLEVHCHVAGLDGEAAAAWDMPKRWAFSESRIHYDPDGSVARLLQDKVPLRPEERRWLMISGITLSEWYINRLSSLWVDRGSVQSAHSMFAQGLNCFYDALFGLNDRLVADHKWRYYYAERLEILPPSFGDQMAAVMAMSQPTVTELERRRSAFMRMWGQVLPLVESAVGMRYEVFKDTV